MYSSKIVSYFMNKITKVNGSGIVEEFTIVLWRSCPTAAVLSVGRSNEVDKRLFL